MKGCACPKRLEDIHHHAVLFDPGFAPESVGNNLNCKMGLAFAVRIACMADMVVAVIGDMDRHR